MGPPGFPEQPLRFTNESAKLESIQHSSKLRWKRRIFMQRRQQIAAIVVSLLLALTLYGLWSTRQPGSSNATSGADQGKSAPARQSPLVDETSLKTAQRLRLLADKPEEQALAAEAVRLADHELDLAFDSAQRDVKTHPPALSVEAKEIQERLEKAQNIQKSEQAQVALLTAEESKTTGSKKEVLDDQLDAMKAELELTDDEVDDATQDLLRAGGDAKWRVEQLAQQHEAASASVDKAAPVNVAPLPEQFGLIHRYQEWDALRQKRNLLLQAKGEAQAAAAALAAKHDALDARIEAAKQASPDLAAHAKKGVTANGASARKDRSHEESVAALARVKEIVADQKDLVSFDKRGDYHKQLASIYGQWIALLKARQAGVLFRALQGMVIILLIALVGLFFNSWMNKLLNGLSMDRRQLQSLQTVTRVSLQIVALLLILLVLFGPPSQLGTFLGLAGAGLTVALKDFIVGFIGWFVLMGKNGMRLGDWVEINGVTGEVVEIGPFHTVLLETGNWTDSGHPTGRRVTFTNSFAIEGHYFNFSTTGQWLWDELQVVLPTGQDPYPMVEALQKKVAEATQESAEEAEDEWHRATTSREMSGFSAAPAMSIRPVVGGVEVSVRYITRANERYMLRSKLNRAAVELLGGRAAVTPPAA
jgi:small-conductance mechanosensitive channel